MLLSKGLEGFEMHPNSFDFFQCDLSNVFSSGGVESFKVFPQFLIVACIAITPSFILDLLQILNIDFFFTKSMHVFGFVPLVVNHVIGVAIASGCDQPITCTSLGKSTSTTPSASTSSMFGAFSSRLVGVKVPNVIVIPTSLKTPKKNKNMNVTFNGFSRTIGQPSFHGLSLWLILMVRCSKCVVGSIQLWRVKKSF